MAIASDFYRVLFQFHNLTKGRLQRYLIDFVPKRTDCFKNNQPSAIILSPEEYTRLTEIEEDYFLLLEANKRLDDNGNKETVSYDSVMKHLGISEAELLEAEDADIE